MGAGDREGLVALADSSGHRCERAHRCWPVRLAPHGLFVLEFAIHEDTLDPVCRKVQEMAVEQHQVGVFAHLNTPDSVVEHHGFRAVDRHDLECLLIGEAVSGEKRTVLTEVAEVLRGHVGLNARRDAGVEKDLEEVDWLWVVVILHDHHGANDRYDARVPEYINHRKDLFGVGERQAVDEAVLPCETHDHHSLARIMRVGVDHHLAPQDGD